MSRQSKPKYPNPDATLRSIMEGTANASGEHFFRSLVQYLAMSLNVKSSFVAEFNAVRTLGQTLAVWVGDQHVVAGDEVALFRTHVGGWTRTAHMSGTSKPHQFLRGNKGTARSLRDYSQAA